jgi:hypothetical protein
MIKPTLDTLMEEDRKALEAYLTEVDERDRKKIVNSNVNPHSSSSCAVNFAQIKPQTSVTSMSGATMLNHQPS